MKIKANRWALPADPFAGLLAVTPNPDGEEGGGSSAAAGSSTIEDPDDDDDDDDDQPLGESGQKALKATRKELKVLRRQLAELKKIDPQAFAETQRRADELERQLEENNRMTEAERRRLEKKHQDQIQEVKKEAAEERNKRVALEIKTQARAAFDAAGGREGADEKGRNYFDAFMAYIGSQHLRLDETTGKVYVVDGQNDPIPAPDGKGRIPVTDWINGEADTSQVVGSFFKPKGGAGSGGIVGARGYRTPSGRDPEQARKAGFNEFANSAWAD
jgi:hypothetical protein